MSTSHRFLIGRAALARRTAFLIAMSVFASTAAFAQATVSVTNTAASGEGSLTAALAVVNACANPIKKIVFAIPTSDPGCNATTGVCLVPGASGAAISCPDVEIDGHTQPGATLNSATDGTFNGQIKIQLTGGGRLNVMHDRAILRGLSFGSLGLTLRDRQVFGVGLVGTTGGVVTGNFFRWHADGLTVAGGSDSAIAFGGTSTNSYRIGGPLSADRNLITAGNTTSSVIAFEGGTNILVEGNILNLNRNREVTAGATSSHGLLLTSSSTSGTGGQHTFRRNVIDQAQNSGINCNTSARNRFTENVILNARLGGNSDDFGIRVPPGCNNNQAAPVINSVAYTATDLTIQGTLNSVANQDYVIEFFHNDRPDVARIGRAERFIRNTTVTTDGTGLATFTVVLPVSSRHISSTASRVSTNDTSRLSSGPFGLRGDANRDGEVTVADVFYLVNFLFAGGPSPLGVGDANADVNVTVADVFYLVSYLFAGGAVPPPIT